MNKELSSFDVGPRTAPLFHSVVELADAYMQLSVPRFECPRQIPPSVHFVGAPPIVPGQAPLSALGHDLDGSRKVVLVTQGTVANHNFGLIAALGDEPDVLVVATTGGPGSTKTCSIAASTSRFSAFAASRSATRAHPRLSKPNEASDICSPGRWSVTEARHKPS